MLNKRAIVEVYEDPLTMKKREGNARVIAPLTELDHGVAQYLVNFVGDGAGLNVVRTIAQCTCTDPVHPGDDPRCPVHGKGGAHV